jgi:soluble P-type ATPase
MRWFVQYRDSLLMIQLQIPAREVIKLHHAVFDLNGTLATDGRLIPGVTHRLRKLARMLTLHILTAGTHGNIAELEEALGLAFHLVSSGEEKVRYIEQLDPCTVIAFGNGANDVGMLRLAALGIAILGTEGLSLDALRGADILVRSPTDALDLVLYPKRLVATLRG